MLTPWVSVASLGPVTPSAVHVAQYLDLVGHDAVNPEVQQSLYLISHVDGPDVHVLPHAMSSIDKSLRHHIDPPVPDRNLEDIGASPKSRESPTSRQRSHDLSRASAGTEKIADFSLHSMGSATAKATHADTFRRSGALQDVNQGNDGRIVLRVQIKICFRK
jgi:hypothetical protein